MSLRPRSLVLFIMILALWPATTVRPAASGHTGETPTPTGQVLWLANDHVRWAVTIDGSRLAGEELTAAPAGDARHLAGDAGFALDLVWTGWRAPGKINNADNPVRLTKQDFRLTGHTFRETAQGAELELSLTGIDNSLHLRLTCLLPRDAFYVRRRMDVSDPRDTGHFLQALHPLHTRITTPGTILKPGGFGQPAALELEAAGAFFGLEYPAATNTLTADDARRLTLDCAQEMGRRIGREWITGAWAVTALTPDRHVRLWFDRYLDDIRVAPLRPYTLYNSWYDLRSPELAPDAATVMNETNIRRIIDLFRTCMIEPYGIHLDAFVLDDGWDVYRSDWVLRPDQFPHGLAPITAALKPLGTDLGLWFGPIGGYSRRDWRVDWMRAHGYETVGDEMCVAGTHYHRLLRQRVTDFTRDAGVAYYKWDGIQFSCSEPDHGHPVGIYSRRAVMEAMIDLCTAVRAINPRTFLNITSGTWLSPWWVGYANQIWMGGQDYAYADVPSISRRDRAITYRDSVLYEDFAVNDFWFPIANLMTHGIIKGHLQKLGGEAEPLDKFTDNALLYLGRGVSMWELYVSPDILTPGEWQAMARSIAWAKDRFPVLAHTTMIGGDPRAREPYGYAHFKDRRGILAVRNPFMAPRHLTVTLDPAAGLDPTAASLVLERVYPTRWISPRLFAAGATIDLPLEGYETAVYEIYPLDDATAPLVAGADFDTVAGPGGRTTVRLYDAGPAERLLNPERIAAITRNGASVPLDRLTITPPPSPAPATALTFSPGPEPTTVDLAFTVDASIRRTTLAVLLEPGTAREGKPLPDLAATLDGRPLSIRPEVQEGAWSWSLADVPAGRHRVRLSLARPDDALVWTGRLSAWLVCRQPRTGTDLTLEWTGATATRPLPPSPWPAGEIRRQVKLGTMVLTLK